MSKSSKINDIIDFVIRHPQTVASRRICKEVIGKAVDRFNEEYALELESGLNKTSDDEIDSFYVLIK